MDFIVKNFIELKKYPGRVKLGIFLFFLFCLTSTVQAFSYHDLSWRPEKVGQYEARLKNAKADLAGQEKISYLTYDYKPGSGYENSVIENYYLSQYILAPLIVEKNLRNKYILGDFPWFNYEEILTELSLKIVKNYGEGLLLLTYR